MKLFLTVLFFVLTTTASFSQNVGIGTISPLYRLHVTSGGTTTTGYFENTTPANDGVWGINTAAAGTGAGSGVVGISSQVSLLAAGVYGENDNATGTGIVGTGNGIAAKVLANGSGGAFTGATLGMAGFASTVATGTGVAGSGNNLSPVTLTIGSGGAFIGTVAGIYAKANGLSANSTNESIYTNNGPLATNVFINAYDGVQQWKILGNGSVSTIVDDLAGKKVVMYAPESPEVYFQDFGQGQLVNGRAHINIDPIFAKNVLVNERHPLRVFIQPEGNCKGTYVSNKTAAGFDVTELDGGNSNISFQWSITCNRADEQLANGFVSKNADARFRPAPVPEKEISLDIKK